MVASRRLSGLARQAKQTLGKLPSSFEALALERKVRTPQPATSDLVVCFWALGPGRSFRGGKVTAEEYLPVFCERLRALGIQTHFATSHRALTRALAGAKNSVVVCIYREVGFHLSDEDLMQSLDGADIVFNHPKSGVVISNKTQSNEALSAVGCPVPCTASALDKDAVVFSNDVEDSGAFAYTTTKAEALDDKRHNTEFIDTRRNHDGIDYFTTIRLMCINNRITHKFMRARPTSDGNPSVHAKDTPRNACLINALYRDACTDVGNQFQEIADRVFEAFGPGFYSHDVLVDSQTGRAFVCETGYKFNDMAYYRQLHELAHDIVGLKGFEDAANCAASSAPVFAEELFAAFGLSKKSLTKK